MSAPSTTETALHALKRRARVERAISLMLAGRTLTEICAEMRVSRTSLWRLRRNSEFQTRFEAAKRDAFDRAMNALSDSALTFVTALRDICLDPDCRDSARANAARSGLDSLFKAAELVDFDRRLRALEAVTSGGGK